MDRISTSFPTELFEHFKAAKIDGSEYSHLKYYQNIARYYVDNLEIIFKDQKIRPRGLLIYYTMGMGKSLTGVAIAMDAVERAEDPAHMRRGVIFLLTKSLQENMRGAIKQYVEMRGKVNPEYDKAKLSPKELDDWISRNFSFVSLNASNMLKQVGRAAAGNAGQATRDVDKALSKVVSGLKGSDLEVNIGEVLKQSLDGKLLIVDEAHNLFRAMVNGAKNAHGLYDMIMKAKDIRLIFMTGTPINNDPFELVPCYNMLACAGQSTAVKPLPEMYKDFVKYFVDKTTGTIKNREKFQNRIMGLTSYVTHTLDIGKNARARDKALMGSESAPIGPKVAITTLFAPITSATATIVRSEHNAIEFPKELPDVICRIPMDSDQYIMYQLARDKEKEEGSLSGRDGLPREFREQASLTKPKGKPSSSYRVRSRQLSNFCPPSGTGGATADKSVDNLPDSAVTSNKLRELKKNIDKHPSGIGLIYSQFINVGGLGIIRRFLQLHGYVEYGTVPSTSSKSNPVAAPKQSLMDNIEGGDDLAMTFAVEETEPPVVTIDDFVAYDTAAIVDDLINSFNDELSTPFETTGGAEQAKKKTFALITGEVDIEMRAKIQRIVNSPENINGDVISLLLVSSTGAEGLDLKNIRHVHVFEPYWNYSRIAQIKARAVRGGSHLMLAPAERTVQSYIYLSVPPADAINPEKSTDEDLYDESVANHKIIESFLFAIQETSIECMLNSDTCRVCTPSDDKLFTDNLDRDIAAIDPCSSVVERKILAQTITVEGITYFYREDTGKLFDYIIYKHDQKINAFRELAEDTLEFEKVRAAIGAKGKK